MHKWCLKSWLYVLLTMFNDFSRALRSIRNQSTRECSCFAVYSAASRMLSRTTSLEEACIQALQWEKVLVHKTALSASASAVGMASLPSPAIATAGT